MEKLWPLLDTHCPTMDAPGDWSSLAGIDWHLALHRGWGCLCTSWGLAGVGGHWGGEAGGGVRRDSVMQKHLGEISRESLVLLISLARKSYWGHLQSRTWEQRSLPWPGWYWQPLLFFLSSCLCRSQVRWCPDGVKPKWVLYAGHSSWFLFLSKGDSDNLGSSLNAKQWQPRG